jgi:hypothetical protein
VPFVLSSNPEGTPQQELADPESTLHLEECVVFCTNDGFDDSAPIDRCEQDNHHFCYPACPYNRMTYAQFKKTLNPA